MMGWLFSLLAGLPGIAEGVLNYLQKKADINLETHKTDVAGDTAINIEIVKGQIEAMKIAADARAADRGSWTTAWMLPTAFGVCILHFGAIVFDSMPMLGHPIGSWKIAELPGAYAGIQQSIILSVAGVVGTKAVAGAVTRIFTKR